MQNHYDQIGLFVEGLGDKFSLKVALVPIWRVLGVFLNAIFGSKRVLPTIPFLFIALQHI